MIDLLQFGHPFVGVFVIFKKGFKGMVFFFEDGPR
jgi:hypothetical protein